LTYAFSVPKNNREVILEAVKNYGEILEMVPSEFKKDKEIIIEAIQNKASALKYAS
jgi:hypothetical protein